MKISIIIICITLIVSSVRAFSVYIFRKSIFTLIALQNHYKGYLVQAYWKVDFTSKEHGLAENMFGFWKMFISFRKLNHENWFTKNNIEKLHILAKEKANMESFRKEVLNL